jgi:hypothetical protein
MTKSVGLRGCRCSSFLINCVAISCVMLYSVTLWQGLFDCGATVLGDNGLMTTFIFSVI